VRLRETRPRTRDARLWGINANGDAKYARMLGANDSSGALAMEEEEEEQMQTWCLPRMRNLEVLMKH